MLLQSRGQVSGRYICKLKIEGIIKKHEINQ